MRTSYLSTGPDETESSLTMEFEEQFATYETMEELKKDDANIGDLPMPRKYFKITVEEVEG